MKAHNNANSWKRIPINKPEALKKIEIGYWPNSQKLAGFKLYAGDGTVLLTTELPWDFYKVWAHTVHLDDGERVIGYKSSKSDPDNGHHYDFQLIIGRLV